ncbi:MAG: 4-(cytidine 5'-diphospho)-2-C-methyl-D-erythritol kinase [Chloroflexi bacterium]|nr:4-(cytidine 5'-diphospho)-2-C-methyl-D-erythritol kinase [Chloroflexota bacterium]
MAGQANGRIMGPVDSGVAQRLAVPARRGASGTLSVDAYAKINLCLEVLGRGDDGLHRVATVMQTVSLADRLWFTPAKDLTLRCRGMRVSPDNLILRAARLLQERTGARAGCAVLCEKRIPVAAGLAGGSADAAATLRALDELWQLGLSQEALAQIGSELGADVPFTLRGGTALATGSGRILDPLPDAPSHWVVLVPLRSPSAAKTAEMYGRLAPADFTDGSATERQAAAIREGTVDLSLVRSAFTRLAMARWSRVRRALSALAATHVAAVSVSGAGPSVFGLYAGEQEAIVGGAALRTIGLPAATYRFVPAHEPRA